MITVAAVKTFWRCGESNGWRSQQLKVEKVVHFWLAAAESASKKNAGGCASVFEKHRDCKQVFNTITPFSLFCHLIASLKATRSFPLVLIWLYSRHWKISKRA